MVVVAPALANPEFDALLLGLLLLCGFIAAAGIIYMLHGFVRGTVGGFAKLVGHVPGIGGVLSSPVNAVYHWMNHEFGVVEAALDRKVAHYFHQLAKLVAWVGDELAAHANLLYTLSTLLLGTAATELLRNMIRLVRHEVAGVKEQVTTLHRSIVRPIAGELHGLERWTYPKVRHALREVDVVIPHDIAGLRARTRAIENGFSDAWDMIRKHEAALGIGALTSVVAIALSRLGLNWLRCDSLGRLGRRIGCGGFGLAEEFLAATFVGLAVTDLCDLAAAAAAVAEQMVPVLMELVDVEDALVGCHGATSLPPFALPTLHLSPTNLGLPLAA
jgi:hypothetical protein